MNYVAIVTQEDLFLDNQKKPVIAGKIEFLDPGSNNLINVYTYEEETPGNFDYVIHENPVYTDINGRAEHTYFTTQLTLCKLYKYIGNFSDPMVDDDTNNWELVRQWFANMTSDEVKQDTVVTTIQDLRNADPSVGAVTVIGYRNEYDCEPRTYFWDANANDPQDGGYVIGSNLTSTGRWILLFNGEFIPSSYYGVYPGNETNMNALLGYSYYVGSHNWPTAPGIYFIRGRYTATGSLTTDKRIQVDHDTYFARTNITCNGLDVIGGGNTNAICDFIFTDHNVVAHSSWFKTITAWVNCGADTLVYDAWNPVLSTVVNEALTIRRKRIIANAPISFTCRVNGAYVIIDNCIIENDYSFVYNNYTFMYFENMEYKDSWFSGNTAYGTPVGNSYYSNMFTSDGSALINRSKHILIDNTVKIDVDNFKNTGFYYRAVLDGQGSTVWDFKNRELDIYFGVVNGNYSNVKFVKEISQIVDHNLKLTNAIFNNCTTDGSSQIRLEMVGKCTYSFNNSGMHISGKNATAGSVLRIIDSNIIAGLGGWLNARTTEIYAENSKFYISIKMESLTGNYVVNDQYAKNPGVSLLNCTYADTHNIASNAMSLINCNLQGNNITAYPYVNGDTKEMNVIVDGCKFYGTSNLAYDLFNYSYEASNVHNIKPNMCVFANNSFYGSHPYGITSPWIVGYNVTSTSYFYFFWDGMVNVTFLTNGYYNNRSYTATNIPSHLNSKLISSDRMTIEKGDYKICTDVMRLPFVDNRNIVELANPYNNNVTSFYPDASSASSPTNDTIKSVYLRGFNPLKVDPSIGGYGDAFAVQLAWDTSDGAYHSGKIIYTVTCG